tara:strand:- start:337 stop:693 length:357 start_codon:yes stop_codon:yes gene_type:complete
MNGKLDPEERVMSELNEPSWVSDLHQTLSKLKWEHGDNIVVEIGGTVVSGIHQGENYNKKWATPYGVRKYNKDAFIVIKNLDRNPTVSSQPNPELKPHHIMVEGQQIPIQQDLNDKTN